MTLYSLNVGNAARGKVKRELTRYRVTSIGRKYFKIIRDDATGWRELEFHIDSWSENTRYSSDHKLYADPQDWEDEKTEADLSNMIYKAFDYGRNNLNLSLDRLEKIVAIIKQSESERVSNE